MKVELSFFGGDLGVEKFIDWQVESGRFYKYKIILNLIMAVFVGFKLKHEAFLWWDRLLKARR